MTKKRKYRRKSKTDENCNSNKDSNKDSCENIKFSDFSYAELVVLSSTLAYSLSEGLDENDLAILIAFLDNLLTNIEILEAQKIIRNKSESSIENELKL